MKLVKFGVAMPNDFTMQGGPFNENDTFQFLQLHFHWGSSDSAGSEHTVSCELSFCDNHTSLIIEYEFD